MRRIGAVLLVLGLLATGVIAAAQQGFMIRGRIGATDQEAQEGYFAIDNQTMIVVKPGTEIHSYLRSRVGQRVRISIEPESGSN
jgi:hypothetical protein